MELVRVSKKMRYEICFMKEAKQAFVIFGIIVE